jgi:hypothetical protein
MEIESSEDFGRIMTCTKSGSFVGMVVRIWE